MTTPNKTTNAARDAGQTQQHFNAGDTLRLGGVRNAAGSGLNYGAQYVTASESGITGGWDVYDGIGIEGEMSFYGYSVLEIIHKPKVLMVVDQNSDFRHKGGTPPAQADAQTPAKRPTARASEIARAKADEAYLSACTKAYAEVITQRDETAARLAQAEQERDAYQWNRDQIRAQRDALLVALRGFTNLARFTTEWNTGKIEPNPSGFAPIPVALWHEARAAIASAEAKL